MEICSCGCMQSSTAMFAGGPVKHPQIFPTVTLVHAVQVLQIISSPSISIISCRYGFLHQLEWDRILMQPEERGVGWGGWCRRSPKGGTQWANLRSFPILPAVALMPILKGEEQRTRRVGAASQHSFLTHVYIFIPFLLPTATQGCD